MSQTTNIIRFKCLKCNGAGEIPNPNFEACASLSEEECEKRYDCRPGECGLCNNAERCRAGEMEECYNCYGSGYMDLDLDKWKYAPNQPSIPEKKEA